MKKLKKTIHIDQFSLIDFDQLSLIKGGRGNEPHDIFSDTDTVGRKTDEPPPT